MQHFVEISNGSPPPGSLKTTQVFVVRSLTIVKQHRLVGGHLVVQLVLAGVAVALAIE